MFCHIGLGKAYRRSYEFFLSDVFTSSGAKKRFTNIYRIEGFLGYPYRILVEIFRDFVIHSYRYSYRQYHVFPENFHTLFLAMLRTINSLYKFYKKNVNKVFNHIDRVVSSNCVNFDKCLDSLSKELAYVESLMIRRILKGRKALTTRFIRATERCSSIINRYFPDLRKPNVYRYGSYEDLENFLKKFFNANAATRYANFAISNSPILVARDGLVLITRGDHELSNFNIFVDDCSETKSYAILKIVGVNTFDNHVYRVKWVSILGIDKHTNQIFLHYVPSTLVLRRAEVCRKWLLGLVDDFGIPIYDNYLLIET